MTTIAMRARLCVVLGVSMAFPAAFSLRAGEANRWKTAIPRAEDYTLMGWADGFPSHTPSARWLRVVRTGNYAMALDTRSLRIPHFGALSDATGYGAAAVEENAGWQRLSEAELTMSISIEGRDYRATAGGSWTDFTGPRTIESGRWLQRADVTDLVFTSDDGVRLNAEARFETVAWPDRLSLILAARPGLLPIGPGETCFGRVGGGYGLDGTNFLEIPHSPDLDPEQFTIEFWVFVPREYQASQRTFPWLVCKNHHEQAEGNFGIVVLNGRPQARMNIGGGPANMFVVDGREGLQIEQWHHLGLTYDGDTMRFYTNGALSGERKIGRKRVAGRTGIAFGRRQDNDGDGYPFRGVVDEIRFYARALTLDEIRARFMKPESADPAIRPVHEWSFRENGTASPCRLSEPWKAARMELSLASRGRQLRRQWDQPQDQTWDVSRWREVALALDPVLFQLDHESHSLLVRATEMATGRERPVEYDAARGWHRVNLDGIEPTVPSGAGEKLNDALERVKLVISNSADREQAARLLFEKTADGFRQRIGSAITGMSAVLRDSDGYPTGIPVQLSKNWHGRPEGGVYSGLWFHGISQVRLPARSSLELELTIAYGHWGGVAAASHAQLCLIGWGSNQLWNQSALGSWGESICYEPDQVQADCSILDVRPLMVRSMSADQQWNWTHNVGGGDFFRLFDREGRRVAHTGMCAAYERYGPCLTEVTFAGAIGAGIRHSETVSLARSDDVVRGTYRLRLDVTKPIDFSRFVLFQIGADTYSYTRERKMAIGNESGLSREWTTQWGDGVNRTPLMECAGRIAWLSLHDAASRAEEEARVRGEAGAPGAWANRGIVIRAWQARLGGQPASPWAVEHGVNARGSDTSTFDIVPPPGVTRLEPGDFVEATVEHLVMPQAAADYYGPNESLREALSRDGNSWRMIQREAVDNDRRVTVKTGTLVRCYPAVTIGTDSNEAEFTLAGGLAYVPVTFSGLSAPRNYELRIDGKPLGQDVHGNDYWQTDYDANAGRWSLTYNIPTDGKPSRTIRLLPTSRR